MKREPHRHVTPVGRRTLVQTVCRPRWLMRMQTKLQVMQIPEMAQCTQLTWKNIFVIIFDAFAANFGGCFANFVVISTFYDPRNALQRLQCEGCAAPERKNLHFNFAINLFHVFIHFHLCCRNEFGGLQTGHRLMMNIDGLN